MSADAAPAPQDSYALVSQGRVGECLMFKVKTTIGRVREFGVLIFLSDFTYWSLCMARPGSGRFGVGFWVGLRARDFPSSHRESAFPDPLNY
jgi:hypothetical protein